MPADVSLVVVDGSSKIFCGLILSGVEAPLSPWPTTALQLHQTGHSSIAQRLQWDSCALTFSDISQFCDQYYDPLTLCDN